VFIPHDLESGKVLGSAIYSPTLVAVEGSYDQVNRLCAEVGDKYGWAFVNINVRPYYAEGSKTLGYEVAEQLGWRAPDAAVAPMASGSLFTKINKGLHEFASLGLIDGAHTRMFGAQNDGCSPIATAWRDGSMNVRPVKPTGIAKSLAIGNPADGYYALKAMHETGGGAASVSDEEVIEGIKLLAATEGIFAETAGGVVTAALKRLAEAGTFGTDETVVAFITGAGLKTQEAVAEHVVKPVRVQPTMTSFEEAVGDRLREPVA
jgi:threonine synthase